MEKQEKLLELKSKQLEYQKKDLEVQQQILALERDQFTAPVRRNPTPRFVTLSNGMKINMNDLIETVGLTNHLSNGKPLDMCPHRVCQFGYNCMYAHFMTQSQSHQARQPRHAHAENTTSIPAAAAASSTDVAPTKSNNGDNVIDEKMVMIDNEKISIDMLHETKVFDFIRGHGYGKRCKYFPHCKRGSDCNFAHVKEEQFPDSDDH